MDQIILVTDSGASSPDPPPGGNNFPNYWGWEFDSNLTDTTGTYTISGGTATFPSGGAVGNYWDFAQFSNTLESAPNQFRFSWDVPWAISVWIYFPASSNRYVNLTFYTSTNLVTSQTSWTVNLDRKPTRFILYDTNGASDIGNNLGHAFRPLGEWVFVTVRYDPANNKQIDTFTNGVLVVSRTYSLDFKPDTDYSSDQTFRVIYGIGDERFDQLAIWYGSVLTDQNILDLYNNGSGLVLP